MFEDEGYFIGGFGDNSSDDELPFSDKKEDVSDEDIVDLPEVVEDTLPSLIDMVVDTVDEHT
ncbi:hypothetical protein J6V86_00635 [bacterium]|nr:hypothetical protein [bacterium]